MWLRAAHCRKRDSCRLRKCWLEGSRSEDRGASDTERGVRSAKFLERPIAKHSCAQRKKSGELFGPPLYMILSALCVLASCSATLFAKREQSHRAEGGHADAGRFGERNTEGDAW